MGCDWKACDECGNIYNTWNMDECDNYGCDVKRCCPWCLYCSENCKECDKLKDKICYELLNLKYDQAFSLRTKMINKSKEELLKAIEKIKQKRGGSGS